MEIKSYTIMLKEIFFSSDESDHHYENFIIPGYQRPYEWTEEQIKIAFESIENSLNDSNEPLLFGTIHLNKTDSKTYEIIDGQQRLTTFCLMLKALEKNVKFNPQNDVNQKFENELASASNENNLYPESLYRKNYLFIKNYLKELERDKKADYAEFAQFILNNIVFVVIETQNNKSIEKTLQIFNSLNTTGLSLDVKDVFKIRLRDYLQKNSNESTENLFEKINDAYNRVNNIDSEGAPYYISENDLIEVFKLFLIGKERIKNPAEKLKMSSQKYFEELFDKNNININITLFDEIATVIKETQNIISKTDDSSNVINQFAKELLDWSGYSKLKNILYLFVYCQNQEIDFKIKVDKSLKLTEIIWKFCSVYRTCLSKIINGVFNYIGENIINPVVNGEFDWNDFDVITNAMKNVIEKNEIHEKANEFSSILEGNVFDNSRAGFFMALSYIDDTKGQSSAKQIKKTLFYRKPWDLDIEHIASKNLYKDEDVSEINSLGNLLYLERKINRSLGADTNSKQWTKEKDLDNKQTKYLNYKWKSTEQKGSQLSSVAALYSNYSFDKWEIGEIREKILERKMNKLNFLKSVYKDFGVFFET